ncbi:MAG: hypothetical protein HY754_06000 [Nitrospirae bacterium]|nr:hypothetical protein [Nitrospirota bacterium]
MAKRGEGSFYKINVILLLYLVTLTAALFVCVLHAEALDVGDSVPDFHIVTIDGKEISYEKDLKGKKPVYLIFWATW